MRILTRYLLADLLAVFLLTLFGMTAFIFVVLIGKEAVDNGLGLGPLVRMVPYLLPQAMQFAVPGTMLLAVTSVYGKFAANNEMVAAKSMGISPWALTWPTLVLATIVSFGAVLLNDVAVSWGRLGQKRVLIDNSATYLLNQLRMNGSIAINDYRIRVRRVDGDRLIQPHASRQSDTGQSFSISADWAELEKRPEDSQIVMRCFNATTTGDVLAVQPGVMEFVISLEDLYGSDSSRSPSNYALSEIGPASTAERQRMERLDQEMTTQAAYAMLTGDFSELSSEAWRSTERARSAAEHKLARFRAEPHRRWANGFSCLAFVMVGVPVAVIFRKGDFLASFFMCFLPILLAYYPLLMFSVEQAKDGHLPPAVVWLGNITLAVAGVFLMRRVERY